MSEAVSSVSPRSAVFDPAEQEKNDPGHFERQGDYDDPRASLVHDDGVPPGRRADTPVAGTSGAETSEAEPPVAGTRAGGTRRAAPTDPDYLAWREAELRSLDEAYQAWRQEQANAYDAAYQTWRDAPGQTSFAQWREAASANRASRRPWSRRP